MATEIGYMMLCRWEYLEVGDLSDFQGTSIGV